MRLLLRDVALVCVARKVGKKDDRRRALEENPASVVRLGTELAIPGWATSAFGLLLIIVLQMLTLVAGLTFSVLFNRNNLTFLPARDYRYFVGEVSTLHGKSQ